MIVNGFSHWCQTLRTHFEDRQCSRFKRRRRSRPASSVLERLEQRTLLSAINGTVFSDRDANGGHDIGEPGTAGVTVYLDFDEDGALDVGEATTVTNADGHYEFADVTAGSYVVRAILPERFEQSPNLGSFYSIDVANRRLMKIEGGITTAVDLVPPAGMTTPALHGLALTNDGELFALEGNLYPSDTLWKIDPVSGTLTHVGPTGQNHAWGMCYDPATDTIYGVAYMEGQVRLGTIDQQTGVFTAISTGLGVPSSGGTNALTGTGGIAFDTVNRRIIAYDFHDGEIYEFALDGTAVKLSQTIRQLSGSLAFDGERFVMERRLDATLIAVDPDAGSWSVIAGHSTHFFEEALEFIPGSRDELRVTVGPDATVTAGMIGVVPPPAAVRGSVWDDVDFDGVRDEGEAALGGVTVYLDLNANGQVDQATGTSQSLDPAQFANGTVLTDALSGATLTALAPSGGVFDTVKAYYGYLGHRLSYGTEATFFGGSFPVLRVDFAEPVDSFMIDTWAYNGSAKGWLRAYDVDGQLIAEYISASPLLSSMETLKVSATGIAYVLASGTGSSSPYVRFGKMTASQLIDEPSTTTAADGSYAFEGLAPGTYHVGQIPPAGYFRTMAGTDRTVYYGTAYVPNGNGAMKLVTVDVATGQITWIGEPLPTRIHGLVRTNSGELYGTTFTNDSLYKIDPATGQARYVGDTGWEITGGLAYDSQTDTIYSLGKPYLSDEVNRLLAINRETGTVTPIGNGIAGMTGTSGLAFDAANRRVIALDNADGEFYEFLLDGTARLLSVGPNVRSYVLSQSPDGFVVQPQATGNGFFSTINPDSGLLGTRLDLSESSLFESLDWNFDRFRYTVELDGSDVTGIDFGFSDDNTAPVVPPQSFAVDEDATYSGTIAATDAENQPLTFQLVSGPTHGRLTLSAGGNFVYTPTRNYHGSDAFTIRAFDGIAYSEPAAVSITVNAVNDPPVAITQTWATDEDASLTGYVYSRDIDGDETTFELVSDAAHGTVTLNPDGTFVYTPEENYFGSDSFVFRVFDGQAYSTNATQTITVRAVNDAPVLIAQNLTTPEDAALTFNPGATDVDGDSLSYVVVTPPTRGTLVVNSDGTLTYRPNLNENGADTFTLQATDGSATSEPVAFTVEIAPVNDAPAITPQTFSTPEETILAARLTATDPDGDSLTYQLVQGPSRGTITFSADGSFQYTPQQNDDLSDVIHVRVYDGIAWSSTVQITIDITPVNDAPVAIPDVYTTSEDAPFTIEGATTADFTGTMTSDPGDYIGQGGTYSLSDESGELTAYANPNHEYVEFYWRNPSNFSDYWLFRFEAPYGEALAVGTYLGATRYPFNELDEPGLSVTGQHRGSNTLTGEFTIWELRWKADGALAEIDISFEQHSEGFEPALHGRLLYNSGHVDFGVLANDSDVEGDPLTASLVTGPANGSLSLNPDGSFNYTPDANFHGTDSFTYVANDGELSSEPATVTIEVTPVNDPPIASGGTFTGEEDATLSGQLNGIDVDGDDLMYVLEQLPLHGELTLNADGTFTYSPDANFNGTDSFTYRVSDGTSESEAATVSLVLSAVNDAPTATGGTFTVRDNAEVGTIVGSVSAADIDGNSLTYSIVSGDPGGYFAIDDAGVIRVARSGIDFATTPTVTLDVLVSDGQGGTAGATVVIDIQPLTASIDVKPGDSSNSLNAKRDRNFSIAILSTTDFDATLIDVGTLTFGATGYEASLAIKGNGTYKYNYRDVNGDGITDLVVDFELDKTSLPLGSSTATLRGRLLDGTDFEAFDEVTLEGGNLR